MENNNTDNAVNKQNGRGKRPYYHKKKKKPADDAAQAAVQPVTQAEQTVKPKQNNQQKPKSRNNQSRPPKQNNQPKQNDQSAVSHDERTNAPVQNKKQSDGQGRNHNKRSGRNNQGHGVRINDILTVAPQSKGLDRTIQDAKLQAERTRNEALAVLSKKKKRHGGAQKSRPDREPKGDADIRTRGNVYMPRVLNDDDTDFYDDEESVSAYSASSHQPQKKKGLHDMLRQDDSAEDSGVVIGRNAVRELLRSGRSVDKVFVRSGIREGSIVVIVAEAVGRSIPVIEVTGEKLDFLAGDTNHQGVVAMASGKQYTDIDGIIAIAKERGEKPLVVIADGIEDPHNLGALIRCAECAGVHGIIIPKRRAVGVTPVVTKASAGAIEHMAIAKVQNISATVEQLKKRGLWIFAAEAGGKAYYDTDFNVPACIILGSEGDGIGQHVREKCDYLVSIPMYGKVNSLNVSTAASVILCHAARMQRTDMKL